MLVEWFWYQHLILMTAGSIYDRIRSHNELLWNSLRPTAILGHLVGYKQKAEAIIMDRLAVQKMIHATIFKKCDGKMFIKAHMYFILRNSAIQRQNASFSYIVHLNLSIPKRPLLSSNENRNCVSNWRINLINTIEDSVLE